MKEMKDLSVLRFNVTVILLTAMFLPVTATAQLSHSNPSDSGVVMGHLHLPGGTAAVGVRVMAVPVAESSPGNPSQVLEAISETDATGSYRLENLPHGRYYIRAGLVELPTYFPGTTTAAEARSISVARGSALSGIDFVLQRTAGVKIIGRVILDPRQKPSPELRHVMLARGAPFVAEAPTDENGVFEFSKVPPGSYSVVIRGAAAVKGIQVDNKDVTGIEIQVPLRYETTARLVVDRNALLPKAPVGIFFQGDHQQGRGSQAQFVDGAPIRILFLEDSYRAMPNDIPEGYTVTSIRQGSLDLMKEPLKIPSADSSDIVVTIRLRQ